MNLTTNDVVITDAIEFVQTNTEKLTTCMSTQGRNNGIQESKEPLHDYDNYKIKSNWIKKVKLDKREETTTIQVF